MIKIYHLSEQSNIPELENKFSGFGMLFSFNFNYNRSIENEISEKASNFSGGEKQKFAIIRALGKDADMIIFDEPDSALDEESCRLLCKCIQRIKQNKIVLLISHNQEMIRISDEIINL